jgi:hypothetical protein
MSTAEDVFYLYERNLRYYNNENNENNICNNVLPFTIGNQESPCNMKVRCYIKPGTECPICYDKIERKQDAFITYCGHGYHKSCLFNYLKSTWTSNKFTSVARCPICRRSIGYPEFNQRYYSSYFSSDYSYNNGLDKLEDFWLCNKYKLPNFCSNGYKHYLGMHKNCFICKSYREKGIELYEIN